MESCLSDPFLAIPSELFCQLLSFLEHPSIATSTAVSTDWRRVVHSDSTLFREIVLSNLGVDSDPEEVLLHLERLSTLALNQVAKVSLNLSSFFKRFETDSKGAGFKTIFQFSSALQVSKHSLREICLTLESNK